MAVLTQVVEVKNLDAADEKLTFCVFYQVRAVTAISMIHLETQISSLKIRSSGLACFTDNGRTNYFCCHALITS